MDDYKRLGDFFARYPELYYSKGSVILNGGDTNNRVYYLSSGVVKEYSVSTGGDVFIIHMYHPGTFFPIFVFENHLTEIDYFETVTPCRIKTASMSDFSVFLTGSHEILKEFTRRLLNSTYLITRRLGVLAGG